MDAVQAADQAQMAALSLVKAIRDVEAAVAALSQRIERGESKLCSLEEDLRQLTRQMSTLRPDDSSDVSASEVDWHLKKLESQLITGHRRLNNQEKAVETIAMVIQSMSNSVNATHEEADREAVNESLLKNFLGEEPEQLDPSSSSSQVTHGEFATHATSSTAVAASAWQAPRISERGDTQPAGSRLEVSSQASVQSREASREATDFPSLQRNGQLPSSGGVLHPFGCRPCSFFCFSKRGCKKGTSCEYCHMLHVSRSNKRSLRHETLETVQEQRGVGGHGSGGVREGSSVGIAARQQPMHEAPPPYVFSQQHQPLHQALQQQRHRQ